MEATLAVYHDLIKDSPMSALLHLDLERHSLWRIWAAGYDARPVDRAAVAGAVGRDLQLDPRTDLDRRGRCCRWAGIVAVGEVGEAQRTIGPPWDRVLEGAIQGGLHRGGDRGAARATDRGDQDARVTDRDGAAVQHALHPGALPVEDRRRFGLAVDHEVQGLPRTWRLAVGDVRPVDRPAAALPDEDRRRFGLAVTPEVQGPPRTGGRAVGVVRPFDGAAVGADRRRA